MWFKHSVKWWVALSRNTGLWWVPAALRAGECQFRQQATAWNWDASPRLSITASGAYLLQHFWFTSRVAQEWRSLPNLTVRLHQSWYQKQSDSELLSLNTCPRALLPPMKHMGEQTVQHVLRHNRTHLIESGWAFYAKAYLHAWKWLAGSVHQ